MDQALKDFYKNLSVGKKIVAKCIAERAPGEKFSDERLMSLLRLHPAANKVKDIEYLVVRSRKQTFVGKVLFFKNRSDDEEDDISYILCLRNLFGRNIDKAARHQKNVVHAFRLAIFGTKRHAFWQSQTKTETETETGTETKMRCARCDSTDSIAVDHMNTPFSEIYDSFFLAKSLQESELQIELVNYAYRMRDAAVERQWIEFHDNIAEFRLLCRSCNSTVGDGGYKKRKRIQV